MQRRPEKIKTLIVDDEPLARRNLRVLLKADPDIDIIGECGSGPEAVQAIRAQSPDLIFLDIQMPGMSGFDVLERIEAERIPAIVFVTAYDQYALKAFEVHALDYLLKPFDDARFEKALQQAKMQIEQREIHKLSQKLIALLQGRDMEPADKPPPKTFVARFMIKSAGRVSFLKADEIDWIEADNYYAKLHVGRKSHLLRQTMNELETQLDPETFVRIHRSVIVNLNRVREMHPHVHGDSILILQDGVQLKLSRSRRAQLQTRLKMGGS